VRPCLAYVIVEQQVATKDRR